MDNVKLKTSVIRFIIGLVFILVIDNIYLSFAKDTIYKSIIDPEEKINITAAVICWIVIVLSIQLLVLSRPDIDSNNVYIYGAILGACSYALYNMTNFAMYPSRWTVKLSLIDIFWGSLLTGVTAYIMYSYK
jgi:uncharacterized membrane protein